MGKVPQHSVMDAYTEGLLEDWNPECPNRPPSHPLKEESTSRPQRANGTRMFQAPVPKTTAKHSTYRSLVHDSSHTPHSMQQLEHFGSCTQSARIKTPPPRQNQLLENSSKVSQRNGRPKALEKSPLLLFDAT